MMLLTKEIKKNLPPLYNTEAMGHKAVVKVKFFCPWNQWTWYATEFDGEDTFFGYIVGHEGEFGYFSLNELKAITGPAGLKIERDLYFGEKTVEEVL